MHLFVKYYVIKKYLDTTFVNTLLKINIGRAYPPLKVKAYKGH